MRINVYAEELLQLPEPTAKSRAVEVVTKTVNQELFYGIRMYLHSPKELHYGTSDDDRSAITFWVPWTKAGGHDPSNLLSLLGMMYSELYQKAKDRGDLTR